MIFHFDGRPGPFFGFEVVVSCSRFLVIGASFKTLDFCLIVPLHGDAFKLNRLKLLLSKDDLVRKRDSFKLITRFLSFLCDTVNVLILRGFFLAPIGFPFKRFNFETSKCLALVSVTVKSVNSAST